MNIIRKHKKDILHFVKFMAVGCVNFGVDYGVLTLLTLVFGVPTTIANTISYTCGLINSFILNRFWTFKIKIRFFSVYTIKPGRIFKKGFKFWFFSVPFLKFIFVNLVSLGVNDLTVYILVDLYKLTIYNKLIAKLIATVFSFIVNFAGSKLLVFREEEPEAEKSKEEPSEPIEKEDKEK